MKNIFLLPLCISYVCGISACNIQPYGHDETIFADEEVTSIDMTNNSESRCGVNGISCNDTALVNYAKTEADYKEYGERTRRDHLYTEAGAGNNLTASVRPSVEDDIVLNTPVIQPLPAKKTVMNDGAFTSTTPSEVGVKPRAYNILPDASKEQLGINNNIHPNRVTQPIASGQAIIPGVPVGMGTPSSVGGISGSYGVPNVPNSYRSAEASGTSGSYNAPISGISAGSNDVNTPRVYGASATPASSSNKSTTSQYVYEVVCDDNGCKKQVSTATHNGANANRISVTCGGTSCRNQPQHSCQGGACANQLHRTTVCDQECEDIMNINNNVITSEFTEESFDIEDYVEPETASEEFAFTNVGNNAQEHITDIDINEVKISDNTILTWEAEEGENLRDLLTNWSALSGWKLLWQTNRNYVLSAGVMFKGKFADVSSALVRAFARARPAPIATYYKGNRVIVIETMENENAY